MRQKKSSKQSNLIAVVFGIALSFTLLGLFELGCGVWNRLHQNPNSLRDQSMSTTVVFERTPESPLLVPVRSGIMEKRLPYGGVLFHAEATIDSHARRVTPDPLRKNPPDSFLIFHGCSFAFGEGVGDNETLPYYTAKLAPRFRGYNYGIPGGDPVQSYFRLQQMKPKTEIQESKGYILYVLIGDHLRRLAGTAQYLSWGSRNLHGYLDDTGQLQTDGEWRNAKPFRTFFYSWLWNREIRQAFHVADWPTNVYSDENLEFTAVVLEKMKLLAAEKFPSSRFRVVLFPLETTPAYERLTPFLKKHNVEQIDLSGSMSFSSNDHSAALLPEDWHPTPETNQIVARELARKL